MVDHNQCVLLRNDEYDVKGDDTTCWSGSVKCAKGIHDFGSGVRNRFDAAVLLRKREACSGRLRVFEDPRPTA